MTKRIMLALGFPGALVAAQPAFAHAGDHAHVDLTAAFAHVMTSPFHSAIVVAGIVGLAGLLWKLAVKR
ncbi:hypothetical protein [Roseibium sp.]|uniref:hypothetical protein n=1 Tax=Roseibium sp. TaxID=1936156 RepID=UPI003A97857E